MMSHQLAQLSTLLILRMAGGVIYYYAKGSKRVRMRIWLQPDSRRDQRQNRSQNINWRGGAFRCALSRPRLFRHARSMQHLRFSAMLRCRKQQKMVSLSSTYLVLSEMKRTMKCNYEPFHANAFVQLRQRMSTRICEASSLVGFYWNARRASNACLVHASWYKYMWVCTYTEQL